MGITTALMVIAGGVMFFLSAAFRTEAAPPIASFNPKHWKPMWSAEVRGWFRSPGYFLMVGGWVLSAVGIVLGWIFVGRESFGLPLDESMVGLVTSVIMLIGAAMFFASALYRTPDAPSIPSFNPKQWVPIWKQQDHFRGPGYALMRWGLRLFSVAFIVRLLIMGWDSWQF